MDSFYIIVIIISLALSFYFAGTETAFVSVNKARVAAWVKQKRKAAPHILKFVKKPERFLYATLIGNNISNIAFASFATVYFDHFLRPGISWLLIVLISIFIGEILPKTFFRSMADWLVHYIVYPLRIFYWLFSPFIFIVNSISGHLLRVLGYRGEELKNFFSRQDIEILLKEAQNSLKKMKMEPTHQHAEFMEKVLELRNIPVKDIMVPRTEIVAVPLETPVKKVIQLFQRRKFTRLPVYQNTLDNIIGVIHVKDLFKQPHNLKEIIRPILYVPEAKKATELMSEFRRQKAAMAVVVDEYGGTAGLVTMEDIIEEVFGEIEDEYDTQAVLIRKIDERTYSVNARIEIEELNQKLPVHIPSGSYETLAGFLLSQFEHIPRREEDIVFNGIRFVITKATRRKIQWVRIELPEKQKKIKQDK